jgi:hypothetical protein
MAHLRFPVLYSLPDGSPAADRRRVKDELSRVLEGAFRTILESEEFQSLSDLNKILSGKWLLSVMFEPANGKSNGMDGSGEESWHAGPGGYTFIEEEHIPTPYGPGYLLGIIWWDGSSKKFAGMECNNQMPSTCDLKGAVNDISVTWDGKTLAIHGIEMTIWHETWSDITSTSFTQTGDVTQPDGSTTRFMTIQGTKAKQ